MRIHKSSVVVLPLAFEALSMALLLLRRRDRAIEFRREASACGYGSASLLRGDSNAVKSTYLASYTVQRIACEALAYLARCDVMRTTSYCYSLVD